MKKRSQLTTRVKAEASSVPAAKGPSAKILLALVAAYILLTLTLIVRVPLNAAPDEVAHFAYVEHLATTERFPVFEPVGAFDPTGQRPPHYEFHQPPLYYLSCLPVWKATGLNLQRLMCRVMSLVYGALTLILLWYAVCALFPDNRALPVLATGFVTLWPLHQGVGASASNDALAGLISSAIFCMIALGARRGWDKRDLVVIGALCGLGLLTKSSCLVMVFVAMGATWHFFSQNKGQDRESNPVLSPPLAVAWVLGVTLLLSGPWLARSQMLYGDPFALGIFNQAFGNDPSAQLALGARLGVIPLSSYLQALFYLLFCTTWGIFGGPETARKMFNPFGNAVLRPEAAPARLPMFICVVATVLVCWGIVRYARNWKAQSAETRMTLVWWVAGFVLVTLAFISFNFRYFQAQARYFHPALLPMALAFALGWQEALCRAGRDRALWLGSAIFGITLVALTLWNALGWRTLV